MDEYVIHWGELEVLKASYCDHPVSSLSVWLCLYTASQVALNDSSSSNIYWAYLKQNIWNVLCMALQI